MFSIVLVLVIGHREISRDWPYGDESLEDAPPPGERKDPRGEPPEFGRSSE